MSDSKNDKAWEQLFEKHKIAATVADKQFMFINSTEINEFREARLMTKFDHKSQLPKLFSDNNLSILPISRGGYIIGNLETFYDFDSSEDIPVTKFNFPNYLESLDYRNVNSEATAINCAFVSDIIQDFTGDEDIRPTVSGRMSSLSFNFGINSNKEKLNINVINSQIEIDGGFEGRNTLSLIEAKNYISKDFIVRQLYYPYKLWASKINKTVRPIFLTYTNGIFHLREYTFDDPNYYNSLRLIQEKKYAVIEGVVNIEVIQRIFTEAKIIPEPSIPFPQADSFDRVINLCELLNQKSSLSKEEITINYDFDERQTNYYTDAGRYLGLIDKHNEKGQIIFNLSAKGNAIFSVSIFDRQIEFIKLILRHSAFRESLGLYFEILEMPQKGEIVEIMKQSNLYNVGEDSTYFRRASTISSWIKWIMDLIEE
jgi:hypothetical protein